MKSPWRLLALVAPSKSKRVSLLLSAGAFVGVLACALSASAQTKMFFRNEPFPSPTPGTRIALNGKVEGIYKIRIQCPASVRGCDASRFAAFDRLTIVDSGRQYGVWVTLASKTQGYVLDNYIAVNIGPESHQFSGFPRIDTGMGPGGGRFSYITGEFDQPKGTFSGSVLDARTGFTYAVVGEKIHALGDLESAQQLSMPVEQILGTYRGKLIGHPGKLVVSMRPDKQIVGYFASDQTYLDTPTMTFSYHFGHWDPELGTLRLVFLNERFFSLGKLAFSVRRSPKGIVELSGVQFTTFAAGAATFTKVQDAP